jgi:hypothetical protein
MEGPVNGGYTLTQHDFDTTEPGSKRIVLLTPPNVKRLCTGQYVMVYWYILRDMCMVYIYVYISCCSNVVR